MSKKMLRLNQGLTLIELLIVIAIIGILSSAVITSLSTSRVRAYDTRVREQLSRFRAAAEVYYSNQEPNGYTPLVANCTTAGTLFTDVSQQNGSPGLYLDFTGVNPSVDVVCQSTQTAYAVKASLPSGGGWCVDSRATSKAITAIQIPGPATVCPP